MMNKDFGTLWEQLMSFTGKKFIRENPTFAQREAVYTFVIFQEHVDLIFLPEYWSICIL